MSRNACDGHHDCVDTGEAAGNRCFSSGAGGQWQLQMGGAASVATWLQKHCATVVT